MYVRYELWTVWTVWKRCLCSSTAPCFAKIGASTTNPIERLVRIAMRYTGTPFTVWSVLGALEIERLTTLVHVIVFCASSGEILTNHCLEPQYNDPSYQRFLERHGNVDLTEFRKRSSTCKSTHPGKTCAQFLSNYWVTNTWMALKVYTGVYTSAHLWRYGRLSLIQFRAAAFVTKITRSTVFLSTYCTLGVGCMCAVHRFVSHKAGVIRLLASLVGVALLLEKRQRHAAVVRYVASYAAIGALRRCGIEYIPLPLRAAALWAIWGTWLRRRVS